MRMSSNIITSMLILVILFFTKPIYADGGCGGLDITFDNDTPYTCYFTDSWLRHGDWVLKAPKIVSPFTSGSWKANQSIAYGPDMSVCYSCGDKKQYGFCVRDTQHYCGWAGGTQYHYVYSVRGGLDVLNQQTRHAGYPTTRGAAKVTLRKTIDFALYAPQGLLADDASSTMSHPTAYYRFRDTWHLYHSATTYDDSNLDTAIEGVTQVHNNTRLVGNSVLSFITHDTKGNRIKTFINITEYHNKLCIIPEKENTIGNVEYNISSFHVREGRYYSDYKPINICGEKPYEITFTLGNMISGLLLPIEVYAYDTAGNRLSPAKLLIPMM